MRACLCVCVCACVFFTCICVCTCLHVYMYSYIFVCIRVHICVHIHTNVYTYTHTLTHTCIIRSSKYRSSLPLSKNVYEPPIASDHVCTYTYKCVHIHTYTYTHLHHTLIQMQILSPLKQERVQTPIASNHGDFLRFSLCEHTLDLTLKWVDRDPAPNCSWRAFRARHRDVRGAQGRQIWGYAL